MSDEDTSLVSLQLQTALEALETLSERRTARLIAARSTWDAFRVWPERLPPREQQRAAEAHLEYLRLLNEENAIRECIELVRAAGGLAPSQDST
jgi:hypothetical protein